MTPRRPARSLERVVHSGFEFAQRVAQVVLFYRLKYLSKARRVVREVPTRAV